MRFQSVIRGDDDVICVEGSIVAGSYEELHGVLNLATGSRLILDLAGLGGINSAGVREWSMFLSKVLPAYPVYLDRCPVAFVDYCNMFPSMLAPSDASRAAVIRSFDAPYHCGDCALDFAHLQVMPVQGERLEALVDADCPQCGAPVAAEVRVEDYLTFLAATA